MDAYCFKIHYHLVLFLGIFLTLTSCQEIVDEPPQILDLSVAGISQENISIDQQQRLITVLLPAKLPALELATTFTLSKQAYLAPYWTEGKQAISLTSYCPGVIWRNGKLVDPKLEIVTTVSNKKQTSTYTIQLKSTGVLRLKPLLTPVVYDSKGISQIVVPVENYYGSSSIEYIAVTKTGSAPPNWIGPGGWHMDNCTGLLNEISIPLAGYKSTLQPGLHDLDLWLADGTKVHAEGYILVK